MKSLRPVDREGRGLLSRDGGEVAVAATAAHDASRRGPSASENTARCEKAYSGPIFFGGQYVANAPPMNQSRGTGPQKRLSADEPRLSPIMNQ